MYIPSSFVEHDTPTLLAFVEAHPLATVVSSSSPDGLLASHLPLILDRSPGKFGTLVGHFARANSHWRSFEGTPGEALVIFTGPDAYVTPEWYRTKEETGRVVPTWNYVAVHAYVTPRLRDDPHFLRQHVEALTRHHEGRRDRPWHVSDAPDDFIAQQVKAIVGVEFRIERLEGKWKMSQNRSAADIDGVVRGLRASTAPGDQAVAAIVSERRPQR